VDKSIDNVESFEKLGLCRQLLDNVTAQGYTSPTPIQAESIPAILEGKDILGGSHTGTGKTAAFVLPLLQRLIQSDKTSNLPRILILAPTRELAQQIDETVRTLGQGLGYRSVALYGGVKMRPQMDALSEGVDIVSATPGRLLDHIRQETIVLKKVETIVFDEADRMLEMGFIHDINKIIEKLPEQRQNLLFSATISKQVKKLIAVLPGQAERIETSPRNSTAKEIRQSVILIPKPCKADLLVHLAKTESWPRILVFTRAKKGADELTGKLKAAGISAEAIHKDKEQDERTQALSDFKNGQLRVLVATDIAARGLDIEDMPCVINYDLPDRAETYVHRIGRTGRAGIQGEAFSLVSPDESKTLSKIESFLNWNIKRRVIRDYTIPRTGNTSKRPRKPAKKR